MKNFNAIFILTSIFSICDSYREFEAEKVSLNFKIPEDGGNERTIDDVLSSSESQTEDGKVLIDLDMILSSDEVSPNFKNNLSSFSGAGIKSQERRWPKGIIPYVMEDDFEGLENNIFTAMKEWMENTCVVFTPKGSAKSKEAGHPHWITISGGGHRTCQSGFGFTKGYHIVNLAVASGCAYHAMALHELGHSIGLAHEQQRPDRDDYLKVMKENIKDKMMPNFEISNDVDNIGIPYDYCSIMHYGPFSYSKSMSKMTFVTKNPNYQFSIGGAKHLSFADIKIVNLMYKCNEKCPKNNRCGEPCYLDHECECQCPRDRPCVKKPCRDYQSKNVCQKLKAKCSRERYANLWCAETCGICAYAKKARGSDIIEDNGDGVGPVVPPTPKVENVKGVPGPKCQDTQSGCSWFASKSNCRSNADIMKTCAKSCKLCLPCVDKHPYCEDMAEKSHCVFDARFMYQDCKISCKLCV